MSLSEMVPQLPGELEKTDIFSDLTDLALESGLDIKALEDAEPGGNVIARVRFGQVTGFVREEYRVSATKYKKAPKEADREQKEKPFTMSEGGTW